MQANVYRPMKSDAKKRAGAGERRRAPSFGSYFFLPPPSLFPRCPRSRASYFHLAESLAQANLEHIRNEKIDEV